jgi:hypothetical protein
MEDFDYHTLYFIIFGLPTWALVDGTWSSLSQLADNLPEGYDISAYLILSLTLGNIFPLVLGYTIGKTGQRILHYLIYGILVLGWITGILLGIFWSASVTIASHDISLPLCILFFCVGACSSSSNVTHYVFVSTYDAMNTTALATGMGLGSMIAGCLGIIQGLWLIDYGFDTTYYYILLSVLYLPAMLSFRQLLLESKPNRYAGMSTTSNTNPNDDHFEEIITILITKSNDVSPEYSNFINSGNVGHQISENSNRINLNYGKDDRGGTSSPYFRDSENNTINPLQQNQSQSNPSTLSKFRDSGSLGKLPSLPSTNTTFTRKVSNNQHLNPKKLIDHRLFILHNKFILSLQFLNSLLGYGFVPAIISFACGKFPNANTILLFATTIGAIIDPIAKYLTNYMRFKTLNQLICASVMLLLLASGLIISSVLPSSSSFYTEGNGLFPMLCYICFNTLFGFTNISVFRYFKEKTNFNFDTYMMYNSRASQEHSSNSKNKALIVFEQTNHEVFFTLSDELIQHAYRYNGIASQSGALVGSVIAFSLVVSNSLH